MTMILAATSCGGLPFAQLLIIRMHVRTNTRCLRAAHQYILLLSRQLCSTQLGHIKGTQGESVDEVMIKRGCGGLWVRVLGYGAASERASERSSEGEEEIEGEREGGR
jgi:hypothetical protein